MHTKLLVVNTSPPIPRTGKNWKTKREIALHIKCSVRNVTSLMRRGVIPYCKCGHFVRFDLDECDRAMQQFRVGSMFDQT